MRNVLKQARDIPIYSRLENLRNSLKQAKFEQLESEPLKFVKAVFESGRRTSAESLDEFRDWKDWNDSWKNWDQFKNWDQWDNWDKGYGG